MAMANMNSILPEPVRGNHTNTIIILSSAKHCAKNFKKTNQDYKFTETEITVTVTTKTNKNHLQTPI